MLRLYGYDLELDVNEVVVESEETSVRSGTDSSGGHWLIVRVDSRPEHLVWMCAPVSVRALQAIATGYARVADVLRHSATGTVEIVSVERGRAVPDRCVCCADIPAELLVAADLRVAPAA